MEPFTQQRKVPFVLFMLLTFIVTSLTPAWASTPLMSTTPDTVVEQEDIDQEFVLKLEDDLLINTQLANYIRLGGDFDSLSVSEVVYIDRTTVTARVYGVLKYGTGVGSFTLLGQALEGGNGAKSQWLLEPCRYGCPCAGIRGSSR
jgi:hypothetical protein